MPAFSEQTLTEALQERAAGLKPRVIEIRVRQTEDSDGNPAFLVELVLPNPPEGEGTWPVDDIWGLRRWVRDSIADASAEDVRWFVTFEPQEPEELAPEDAADQVQS